MPAASHCVTRDAWLVESLDFLPPRFDSHRDENLLYPWEGSFIIPFFSSLISKHFRSVVVLNKSVLVRRLSFLYRNAWTQHGCFPRTVSTVSNYPAPE